MKGGWWLHMSQNNTDQWKSDGDCKLCRRNPYCTKVCRASRNRLFQKMSEKASELIAKRMEGKNNDEHQTEDQG
jgi:hypothetical protein